MKKQPAWWAERIEELLGVSPAVAEQLVGFIDDLSCWMLSSMPDVRVIRVPVGGRYEGGTGLMLRAAAGVTIAWHRHASEERVLVLQGGICDDAGRTVLAGELLISAAGSSHSLRVVGPEECVCCLFCARE